MPSPKPDADADADRVEHCRLQRDELLGLGETDPADLVNPFTAWTTKPRRPAAGKTKEDERWN